MEGCNFCGGCDSCEKCDEGCQGTCDSSEAFCATDQNSNNGFKFSKCVASGQIICDQINDKASKYFSRDTWNEAIQKINEVFSAGGAIPNDKGTQAPTTAESSKISKNITDKFITAAEFERVATVVNHKNDNVKSNAVIYGKYFTSLEEAVANLEYKDYQCSSCNHSCDVECDKCQLCDDGSCQTCNAECNDYCCDCDCCDSDQPPPTPPTPPSGGA